MWDSRVSLVLDSRLQGNFHHVGEGGLAFLGGAGLLGQQVVADGEDSQSLYMELGGDGVEGSSFHFHSKDAVSPEALVVHIIIVETVSGVEYTVFGLPAEMAGKNLNLIFNNNGGGQQLADFAITVPEDEIFLNINANYYVDFTGGNPRGEDSYIYVLDNMGWGENLHMYAWGDSEIFGGWAGAAGEAVGSFCGTPAYRFLVVAEHSGKTEHLIFNNGNGGDGNQFDGPEVKVGEDLFYSISDYTCDVAEPVVRVYVQDNTGWDALYVYVWGTSEIFGGWPGAAVSGEQTIGETTYKYAEIPAACFGNTANIIFNNNAGTQLENFDVLKDQKVGSDFFFTLTGDSVTTGK